MATQICPAACQHNPVLCTPTTSQSCCGQSARTRRTFTLMSRMYLITGPWITLCEDRLSCRYEGSTKHLSFCDALSVIYVMVHICCGLVCILVCYSCGATEKETSAKFICSEFEQKITHRTKEIKLVSEETLMHQYSASRTKLFFFY